MRLSLLILLALLAVTWFEFQIYPGHRFLSGDTQLLVPMLERLDTPGFLSRDLVASHPALAYTIYDEITQLLHTAARLTLEQSLTYQQILFRFLSVLGVYLLARALRVGAWPAVSIAALVNAVTHLAAPNVYVTSPDPTPLAFAFSLVLLAAGLLVNRFALLAGLAGGIALIYNPVTALPFWLIVIILAIANREARLFLRPAFLSLLIFSLLLGNFSQLQAGVGAGQDLLQTMAAAAIHVTALRTPWIWITHWAGAGIWSYLFSATVAVLAFLRLGSRTNTVGRTMLLGLVFSGLISALAQAILLARPLQFAAGMPLTSNLALTIAAALVLAGAAFWRAVQNAEIRNSLLWALFLGGSLLNAQVLSLLHGDIGAAAARPVVTPELNELARWANEKTWGSSMFQFQDSGLGAQPAIFRALSRRSLWADWQSGIIADYSVDAGQLWWQRWQAAGMRKYSLAHLLKMLPLPIDYYVLKPEHAVPGAPTVFRNRQYLVYDAQDLRQIRR